MTEPRPEVSTQDPDATAPSDPLPDGEPIPDDEEPDEQPAD